LFLRFFISSLNNSRLPNKADTPGYCLRHTFEGFSSIIFIDEFQPVLRLLRRRHVFISPAFSYQAVFDARFAAFRRHIAIELHYTLAIFLASPPLLVSAVFFGCRRQQRRRFHFRLISSIAFAADAASAAPFLSCFSLSLMSFLG